MITMTIQQGYHQRTTAEGNTLNRTPLFIQE